MKIGLSKWAILWEPKSAILQCSWCPFVSKHGPASSKNCFSKHVFPLVFTFFNLIMFAYCNYLFSLYQVCKCISNDWFLYVTNFYWERYLQTDIERPRSWFHWKSRTCFMVFYFLALNWVIQIWCQIRHHLVCLFTMYLLFLNTTFGLGHSFRGTSHLITTDKKLKNKCFCKCDTLQGFTWNTIFIRDILNGTTCDNTEVNNF